MAAMVWGTNTKGGYMFAPNLSKLMRTAMQPLLRFYQFTEIEKAFGKNMGDEFNWNIFSNITDDGAEIPELDKMPESGMSISRGSMTVKQYGIAVPYTGMLDDLSEQPLKPIIKKSLKNNAVKTQERLTHAQFDATLLTVTPASAADASAVTFETTGTPTVTNNVAMTMAHVGNIVDEMKERGIPAFDGTNYGCISRVKTIRPLKTELEAVAQYTESGFGRILQGEVGRSYDNVRFFEQTEITSESWSNAKSDAAYFFGDDTVTEAVAVPVEIRGKLPGDYGLDRGIAWYALQGFGIVHNQTGATENRIVKWASAA